MEAFEPYPSLALALLTGLLVGLEREHSKPAPDNGRRGFTGGVRTYPLFSLLGATASLMQPAYGALPLFGATMGLSLFLAIGYWRDAEHGHVGLTSEASAMLTFFLGALSASHGLIEPVQTRVFVVSSIAVAATFLLSQKTELRQFSAKLSRDDVIATVKFLLIAVVVLPVLPNEPLGPYGALNPYRIGFMVLLIAGIGFVGYVAMRLFGHGRGLLITGAIGGLVSSTAVTLASAARAKQTPQLAPISALAVVIANTIMFVRVLVTVAVVETSLLPRLSVPLGVMALVNLVAVGVLALRDRAHRNEVTDVELTNPFELRKALQFGAFFVFILVASRWATETMGDAGTYLTGLLAGLTDVDAITLTMSNLVKGGTLAPATATRTIVLAVASNTVVKGVMAVVLGGWAFGRRIVEVSGVALVLGLGLARAL
ncbi:MAG: DUF4010 domain-containing protein [Myxococcaceae bacterium]|nr:DUF4010 domain-containing protein [Myxococcaceae bacterium]